MPHNTATHVIVGSEIGNRSPAGLKLSSEAHELSLPYLQILNSD